MRGDMNALYKYIRGVNTREREEQFKLKDNIGTRGNGYKWPMNKFKLQIKVSKQKTSKILGIWVLGQVT